MVRWQTDGLSYGPIPRTIAAGLSVLVIGQQWCHSRTRERLVFDLGNGQRDIPQLRKLLPQVLSDSDPVKWFDAERGFPALGRTNLLLNALQFATDGDDAEWILLVIEDDSDRSRAACRHEEGWVVWTRAVPIHPRLGPAIAGSGSSEPVGSRSPRARIGSGL